MTSSIMNELVGYKVIKSYKIEGIDETGNPGRGQFRNSQRLTIEFNDGKILILETYCSGCNEDTGLFIKMK